MSTISSLYPKGTYLSGKPFDIEVTMQVPDGSYSIVIDRVDLIGKQIFVLSSVVKEKHEALSNCKINVFMQQLTVKIPKTLDDDDIKVNIYMISTTSAFRNSFYNNDFTFIQSETSYLSALKAVEAYENSYCQLF